MWWVSQAAVSCSLRALIYLGLLCNQVECGTLGTLARSWL